MDMFLSLNGNNNSLEILKLSLLYFDNITIDIPCYFDVQMNLEDELAISLNPLMNEEILQQVLYLRKEYNINVVRTEVEKRIFDIENEKLCTAIHHASFKLLAENLSIMYENIDASTVDKVKFNIDTIIRHKELREIVDNTPENQYKKYLKHLLKRFNISGIEKKEMKDVYYSFWLIEKYLSSIFYNLIQNRVTLSDSSLVNELVFKFYNKKEVTEIITNKIKLNCASILLPNFSNATFDDIYEIKYKMKDELIELRYYINTLTKDIDIENDNYFEDIVCHNINPAIRNLEYKMKDLKIGVAQKFLSEIKNPLSYAPLLGTMFAEVPSHIALFASLGFISLNTELEYLKQMNNIKKDNMYFLFKLRNRT